MDIKQPGLINKFLNFLHLAPSRVERHGDFCDYYSKSPDIPSVSFKMPNLVPKEPKNLLPQITEKKETLPDGREYFLKNDKNGNIKLEIITRTEPFDMFNCNNWTCVLDGKNVLVYSLEKTGIEGLKKGHIYKDDTLKQTIGFTFHGIDTSDNLVFGNIEEFSSSEEFEEFKNSIQIEIDKKKQFFENHDKFRSQKAEELKNSIISNYNLSSELINNPVDFAQFILKNNIPLAFNGCDLWAKDVLSEVENCKRQNLKLSEVINQKGLLEIRLQEWLASQRGECLLYRGIKGHYKPEKPGSYYTSYLQTALCGYGNSDNSKEINVIGIKIPKSLLHTYLEPSGIQPGGAPYADVYKIPNEDFSYLGRPMLLISDGKTDQKWLFDKIGTIKKLSDNTSVNNEIKGIIALITGKGL